MEKTLGFLRFRLLAAMTPLTEVPRLFPIRATESAATKTNRRDDVSVPAA